jgi:putative ABC transport system permease protein
VRQGLALAACGIAAGSAAAWLLSRLMTSLLFGVAPTDPATYATVSVALAAVVLVAGYVPARRAARSEPVVALRTEN